MNIEICKRCKLKPFLWIRKYKKTDVIKYIVCSPRTKSKECLEMAEIDDETYIKLMYVLMIDGYAYEGYETLDESITMICLLGKESIKDFLNNIEINNQCQFHIEHQISKLNPKNES